MKTENVADRLGSVRQVIDVNGCVRHLYSYGPFGKKLEADDDPGGPGNNFQFTGQYFDAEIDQLHLRARQYSPHLNIFTSRDPVSGNFSEPLTLHAYLYCLNDPVNRTDLFGDFSLLGTLGAGLNYGFKAYSAYSTYQNVKGYAEQLAEGVALRSILLDVAIDAGINYAGGKIFDAAVKGIAAVGGKLLSRTRSVIEKHHVIPKFLGGTDDGMLIGIARDPHRGKGQSYHNILRKHLKRVFGDDTPKYIDRNAKAWAILLEEDPINKIKASQALLDAAAEFDELLGGDIMTTATVEELINHWF